MHRPGRRHLLSHNSIKQTVLSGMNKRAPLHLLFVRLLKTVYTWISGHQKTLASNNIQLWCIYMVGILSTWVPPLWYLTGSISQVWERSWWWHSIIELVRINCSLFCEYDFMLCLWGTELFVLELYLTLLIMYRYVVIAGVYNTWCGSAFKVQTIIS